MSLQGAGPLVQVERHVRPVLHGLLDAIELLSRPFGYLIGGQDGPLKASYLCLEGQARVPIRGRKRRFLQGLHCEGTRLAQRFELTVVALQ